VKRLQLVIVMVLAVVMLLVPCGSAWANSARPTIRHKALHGSGMKAQVHHHRTSTAQHRQLADSPLGVGLASNEGTTSLEPSIQFFPDGYAVTQVTLSPIASANNQALAGLATPMASGSGGSSSYSGSRYAYVTTDFYDLGVHTFRYKTGVYWEWKASTVTRVSWVQPQYYIYVYLLYYGGSTYGPSTWQTWSGHSHGQNYRSITGNFYSAIVKYGTILNWDVFHEFWVRGNGTYSWRATVSTN
jgi:hypothetical protein